MSETPTSVTNDAVAGADLPPPPSRALRRALIIFGAFIFGMVGLRLWWGWVAAARLEAKIAELRAAGEPVLISDFQTETAADQACAPAPNWPGSVNVPTGELPALIAAVRRGSADPHALRQFLTTNQELLRLARTARAPVPPLWQVDLRSPISANINWSTSFANDPAEAAAVAALCHHALGEDREAAECLRDVLALGRHARAAAPILLWFETGQGIDRLGLTVIEEISHALRVGETDVDAATRDQVVALVHDLLDEDEQRASWARAVRGQRMATLDLVQSLSDGRAGYSSWLRGAPTVSAVQDRAARWFFGPAWGLEAVRITDRYTAVARAADAPSWPAARRIAPPEASEDGASAAETLLRGLRRQISWSAERSFEVLFRRLALRRMAATALAMRLYQIEQGARPDELTALVPEYLSDVPPDPLADPEAPLRYQPDAAPPRLYSVGYDGVDNGGAYDADSFRSQTPGQDQVFFLDGGRR